MDDKSIVELFWQRSERAIPESQNKYNSYCTSIAVGILGSREDAEECVNDTWMRAWNSIPDNRPSKLSVFLGKITRNISIDRYRKNTSLKNNGGQFSVCLDELAECTGNDENLTDDIVWKDIIDRFLGSLKNSSREVFMYRYWYMFSVDEIAWQCDMTKGAVKMSLQRTRKALKDFLEREGITI
ncbi:MAG: RNA polymerase sigma factor [Oscillospiraceae bacterium]|nr:RNA polymerase sigma factor [Oscillospiraceae bacterium]